MLRQTGSSQKEEALQFGRGKPTHPPDPNCSVCNGKGVKNKPPYEIYCTCRYRVTPRTVQTEG